MNLENEKLVAIFLQIARKMKNETDFSNANMDCCCQVCGLPEINPWIASDSCDTWYHVVNLDATIWTGNVLIAVSINVSNS